LAASALVLGGLIVGPAGAARAVGVCSPTVAAVGFSDALDKTTAAGESVAGISALAHDRRSGRYLALPDHTEATALVWPLAGLDDVPVARPRVAGPPLRLRGPDGRLLPGRSDTEGLAVLADGSLAVSAETGPALRVFGRDGAWRYDVPVPPRFAPAPVGRAVPNAGFEGLAATPSGRRVVAAMERPLLGEDPGSVVLLDYRVGAAGRFILARELRYRPAPGMRVAEIAAYREDRLVVLEAAYSARRGNSVVLADAQIGPVAGPGRTRVVHRRPLADLVHCPTMGARSREYQRNPLLDNYEAMAVVPRAGGHTIHLVSDDNHSKHQTTRLLTLWASLP